MRTGLRVVGNGFILRAPAGSCLKSGTNWRFWQSLTIGLDPTISGCATRKRIGKYVCWLRRMIQRRQIHLIVNRQRPHWTELRLSRSLLPSANKHFIATSAMRPALADMIAVTICDKGMISGLTCTPLRFSGRIEALESFYC